MRGPSVGRREPSRAVGAVVPAAPLAPPRPFQRLQWRLTLSYLLTTVLAVVLIEAAALGCIGYYLFWSRAFPARMARDVLRDAQEAAPLLAAAPLDGRKLQGLVDRAQREPEPARDRGFEVTLGVRGGADVIVVTDSSGRVLACSPEEADVARSEPLDTQVRPVERPLLTAALRGETDPAIMAQRIGGTLVVAAPVFRPHSREVVGAAFFRSRPIVGPEDSWGSFVAPILGSAAVVALFSGLVGGGLGYFTARRLTGRLGRMAAAAASWARGDLSASAPDTPPDELGVLAGRLNHMARELSDLIALRQDVATLEERNRLARDLHDTVKQQVFAVAMQVGAARALLPRSQEMAAERLSEAERMANAAQQELSGLIRELRPVGGPAGPESGLPHRLQSLVEDWSRQSGVAGEFLSGDVPAIESHVAEEFVRITQEALSNVARHSGATTARVFLSGSRRAGTVTLSVTDNGCGFHPAASRRRWDGGFGLTTMRERAQSLPAGVFLMTSAPGSGTRIEVRSAVGEIGPLGDTLTGAGDKA